jgi:hypothetical protein
VSPQVSPPPAIAEAVPPPAARPQPPKPRKARPTVKKERTVGASAQTAGGAQPIEVAGERAVLLPSPSSDASDSRRLSAISLLLILSLAAAGLLLSLAAVPRAWTLRYGFVGRLGDVRAGLRMAGTILIVESAVVALMLMR